MTEREYGELALKVFLSEARIIAAADALTAEIEEATERLRHRPTHVWENEQERREWFARRGGAS